MLRHKRFRSAASVRWVFFRLRPCPGRRFFGRLYWDLDELGAVEGSQWHAANPGYRFFGRLCWDLDEAGAVECSQRVVASPGPRFFERLCWDLDVVSCLERPGDAARRGDSGRL